MSARPVVRVRDRPWIEPHQGEQTLSVWAATSSGRLGDLLACRRCLKTTAAGQHKGMGIGVGIFLVALGAILTFAVDWTVTGLDVQMVGRVLMVAGVVGLILFFVFWSRQRAPRTVAVSRQPQVDVAPRTYDDATPPPPTTLSSVERLAPALLEPSPSRSAQETTVTPTAPIRATPHSGTDSSR